MSGIDYRDTATGLRIKDEPYPNGIRARAVYRGDERIYHDRPEGLRHFMRGYMIAKAEPLGFGALMHNPMISDIDVLAAADALRAEAKDAQRSRQEPAS